MLPGSRDSGDSENSSARSVDVKKAKASSGRNRTAVEPNCEHCLQGGDPLFVNTLSEEALQRMRDRRPVILRGAIPSSKNADEAAGNAGYIASLPYYRKVYEQAVRERSVPEHFINFQYHMLRDDGKFVDVGGGVEGVHRLFDKPDAQLLAETFYSHWDVHMAKTAVMDEMRRALGFYFNKDFKNMSIHTVWVMMGHSNGKQFPGSLVHLDHLDGGSQSIHGTAHIQVKGGKNWKILPPSWCRLSCGRDPTLFSVKEGEVLFIDPQVWDHGTFLPAGVKGEITVGIASNFHVADIGKY